MKLFVLIAALLFCQAGSAQVGNRSYRKELDSVLNSQGNVEARQHARSELSGKLQKKLSISETTADSVLAICDRSGEQMRIVARDPAIRGEDKTARLKAISESRKRQLTELLSPEKFDRALTILAGKEK